MLVLTFALFLLSSHCMHNHFRPKESERKSDVKNRSYTFTLTSISVYACASDCSSCLDDEKQAILDYQQIIIENRPAPVESQPRY